MSALPRLSHLLHADDPEHPDDNRQERIDAKAAELLQDRDAVLEADCAAGDDLRRWCDVRTEIQTALADLARTDPSDLLDSDVLTRLYELAAGRRCSRMVHLEYMAEEAVDRDAKWRPEVVR